MFYRILAAHPLPVERRLGARWKTILGKGQCKDGSAAFLPPPKWTQALPEEKTTCGAPFNWIRLFFCGQGAFECSSPCSLLSLPRRPTSPRAPRASPPRPGATATASRRRARHRDASSTCQPRRSTRRSSPAASSPQIATDSVATEREKGVLGVNLTSRDVKECNKRGCFHIHGQAQGGATPELIAFVAEDARLRSVQKREKWTPALALAPNYSEAGFAARYALIISTTSEARCTLSGKLSTSKASHASAFS